MDRCVSGGGHPEQGHCPTGPYKKMIDEVLAKMRVIIVSKQLASHNTKNVSIYCQIECHIERMPDLPERMPDAMPDGYHICEVKRQIMKVSF